MHAAIYLRVSTTDGRQTTANQLRELETYCHRKGYTITQTYTDHESGTKGRKARAGLNQLFQDARRKAFDVLVFWSVDRFTREGIYAAFNYFKTLDRYGVRFESYQEEFLSTQDDLLRDMLLAFMSYFAELEAKKISERTKAGLARAKAQGTTLGRPSKKAEYLDTVLFLFRDGWSAYQISQELDLAYNTVRTYLREAGALED